MLSLTTGRTVADGLLQFSRCLGKAQLCADRMMLYICVSHVGPSTSGIYTEHAGEQEALEVQPTRLQSSEARFQAAGLRAVEVWRRELRILFSWYLRRWRECYPKL